MTDEDGDTPLYTVESIETATWLVEHGARVDRVNSEGITVCDVNYCKDKVKLTLSHSQPSICTKNIQRSLNF